MKSCNKNKQKGLTLIELMIALVLGLLLVAGVVQVFISNKQTARVTEAQSRLQDNARFALEILTRDIRSAGYSGCRAIENINVNTIANAPIPATPTASTIITGSNAGASSWTPAISGSLGTVVTGTDVITIQRGTSCGANLVGNIGSSNGNIQVFSPNTCSIAAGDVLMIADCEDSHIFRASNVSNGTGQETVAHASSVNGSNHFCKSYPSGLPDPGACATGEAKLYGYDSEIFKFSAVTYFIRLGTNGNPSLWVYDQTASGTNNPSELVEGIESLQVEYGADDNGDDIVDRYETANTIDAAGDWDKVVSAQISILAQTLDTNLTTSNQKVTYNGSEQSWTDGRLRRVFTTTVAIRNRVQ